MSVPVVRGTLTGMVLPTCSSTTVCFGISDMDWRMTTTSTKGEGIGRTTKGQPETGGTQRTHRTGARTSWSGVSGGRRLGPLSRGNRLLLRSIERGSVARAQAIENLNQRAAETQRARAELRNDGVANDTSQAN